jgi:hypothetical protein
MPDYLVGTVRPSSKSWRSAQLVRSVREGSTASLSLLKLSCFLAVLGPRFSIIRFQASNSAGGYVFAVCVNHVATASSEGLALTDAVN